jgi:dipeptidyl aminopeptidase/acylaminoacyl peptidase
MPTKFLCRGAVVAALLSCLPLAPAAPAADTAAATPAAAPATAPAAAKTAPTTPTAPRPFTAMDLVTMHRVQEHVVSPDGNWVVWSQRAADYDNNRGRTDLWIADIAGKNAPRRLTTDPASDSSPTFAADGKSLFFLSSRGGSSQVWRLPLDGGEAQKATSLPLDVGAYALSPDNTLLAVALEVFVDCANLQCTSDRLAEKAKQAGSGQMHERIFARHWDTWADGRRNHVFVLPVDGGKDPVDVAQGLDGDAPSKPFGGAEEMTFTPDSRSVIFSARVLSAGEPWSTNFDLYVSPVDGSAKPKAITDNPAWDTRPIFAQDGKTLLYLAMARPGYEADRFQIMLKPWPDGAARPLAADWDRSPDSLSFAPDGKTLYVTADDVGNTSLSAIDVATGKVSVLIAKGHVRNPAVAGSRLVYGYDTLQSPVDLYVIEAAKPDAPRRLTEVNRDRLAEIRFGDFEQFSFPGWNDEQVHGYVVKPFGFEAGKKYPLAFIIHGGPQGSMKNEFHYRWNAQSYAAQGFAVLMIDFHGSTGYGQAFTDAIAGDWGGKPLVDLQKGLAYALEKYPFIDGQRACALGASYGGYMINWIAGNWPDAFQCLVNHDGLFNLESMYYATEELWFPEWEFGGPAYDNYEGYNKFNPMRFVKNWKTPMMVIHGGLDYRVVDTEGLATFTALQRRGIPSQLLYFPDENHWVLKPKNSVQWHEAVVAWLQRWTAEKK